MESTTHTLAAKGPSGAASAIADVTVSVPAPPPVSKPEPKTLLERINEDLTDVYFDFDTSDIRDDARNGLVKDADALRSILADFPEASASPTRETEPAMNPRAVENHASTIRRRKQDGQLLPGQAPARSQNCAGISEDRSERNSRMDVIDAGTRGRAMMLVTTGTPRRKNPFLLEFLFVLITVGPWVLMIWLLWPRR